MAGDPICSSCRLATSRYLYSWLPGCWIRCSICNRFGGFFEAGTGSSAHNTAGSTEATKSKSQESSCGESMAYLASFGGAAGVISSGVHGDPLPASEDKNQPLHTIAIATRTKEAFQERSAIGHPGSRSRLVRRRSWRCG